MQKATGWEVVMKVNKAEEKLKEKLKERKQKEKLAEKLRKKNATEKKELESVKFKL